MGYSSSAIHEYRSGVRFPINGVPDSVEAFGYRTISTLLEIRILSATVSWQFRNLLGERYDQVPPFMIAAADELLRRALGVLQLTNVFVTS